MTAELEEIVEDPDILEPEQIGPNARQALFGGIAGSHELLGGDLELAASSQQGGTVDLAVRRER